MGDDIKGGNKMDMKLTIDDINILIEAVGSWTSRKFAGEIMGTMLEAMLVKDDKARKERDAKKEQDKLKKKHEEEREKCAAELIKAKLVVLKQELLNAGAING